MNFKKGRSKRSEYKQTMGFIKRKDHKETMGFLKFNECLQKTPYSTQVSYNLYLFL
jgi:hypothetical protein